MHIKKLIARSLFTSLLTVASISTSLIPAYAQDGVWKNSYQLETAGKYAEAMAVIDSISVNSSDAEFKLLRRGWLFYLNGRFDESIREYRLAIDRNSKSIDARLGLTLPLLAAQRWREAEQVARAALDLAPINSTALVRMAMAQEGQRDWPAMIKTSASLVSSFPSNATGYVYLARAYAWLGRNEDAATAYSSVLVRLPGHLEATAYLAKK